MDFFDNPDLLTSGSRYKGEPATFLELAEAVSEKQRLVDSQGVMERKLMESFDARDDALEKAGLGKIGNPLRRTPTPEEMSRISRMVGAGDDQRSRLGKPSYMLPTPSAAAQQHSDHAAAYFLREYEEKLKELEAKNPQLASVIRASKSPLAEVAEAMRGAEKKADEAQQGRNEAYSWLNPLRTAEGLAANVGGFLYGQRESPYDMLSNIVGLDGIARKALLKNALRAAGSNAAVQAMLEPGTQAARSSVGLESGIGPALENIAMAGLVGGGLDTAFRAPVRAYNRSRGVQGLGGVISDAPDPNAILPAQPQAPETPASPTPDLGISPDLMDRLDRGDPAAMAEARALIDRVPELKEDPVVRGALAAVEIDAISPLKVEGVDDGDGIKFLAQSIRSSIDPQEPTPRLPADTPAARFEFDQDRAMRVMAEPEMDAMLAGVKQSIDNVRPGVSNRIEGLIESGHPLILDAIEGAIKKARAGEDAAKIADGFTKDVLSLAAEVGPDRLMAMADLHSGRSNPLDMARAIRDMPDIIDSNTPMTQGVQMARSLARLSDTAFDMVAKGEADPILAQIVSDHVSDPMQHAGVIDDLKRSGLTDPDEIRRAIPDLVPPERIPDAMPLDAGSKMDDPAGPEAKAQTERLAAEYATEIAETKATLDARKAQAEARQQALEAEQALVERAALVRSEVEKVMGIVPSDFQVKVFTGLGDLPEATAKEVMRANAKAFQDGLIGYQNAKTDEARLAARQQMDQAMANRSVEAMVADDVIWIGAHAMNPQGRVAHETIHALVATGRLTRDEMRMLADSARQSGIFGPEREALYRAAYEVREGVTPERLAEMLDEEAAAHRLEAAKNAQQLEIDAPKADAAPDTPTPAPQVEGIIARVQAFFDRIREAIGKAMGAETKAPTNGKAAANPVSDLLDALLSGEIAKREAMAKVMRSENISALAVRAEAMFATTGNDTSRTPARGPWDASSTFDERMAAIRKTYENPKDLYRLPLPWDAPGKGFDLGYLQAADIMDANKGVPAQIKIRDLISWQDNARRDDVRALTKKETRDKAGEPKIIRYRGNDIIVDGHHRLLADLLAGNDTAQVQLFDPRQSDSPNLMFAMADRQTGQDMRRTLDGLGFYSKLDEVLGSLGPKDKVTAATLQQKGVKLAEIEARGLKDALADGKSAPVSDLLDVAGKNKVELREVQYRDSTATNLGELMDEVGAGPNGGPGTRAKWSSYSLDPSNPTYRETVIHLPKGALNRETPQWKAFVREMEAKYGTKDWFYELDEIDSQRRLEMSRGNEETPDFRQSHFRDDPNVIGHMMTSMTTHEGRPVFTVDQIQSDWGQKLRDGGVRDEAKIAELQKDRTDARAELERVKGEAEPIISAYLNSLPSSHRDRGVWTEVTNMEGSRNFGEINPQYVSKFLARTPGGNAELATRINEALSRYRLLDAELATAEASSPGNPLVNSTDQWTNTTLRRAIRQAAEADAAYIAIPHGDTVLSYNPEGQNGPNGMREFYGRSTKEGIVPKNLRKLLQSIDKASPAPTRLEKVETPSKGLTNRGDLKISDGGSDFGFTIFPLTDKVKQSVKSEGQVMFAFAGERAKTADLEALARAKKLDADGTDRTQIFTDTGWFKGVDGKWRFEIDDSKAKLKFNADDPYLGFDDMLLGSGNDGIPLTDFIHHPTAVAAYGRFNDVNVVPEVDRSFSGTWRGDSDEIGISPNLSSREMRKTALHEMQHGMQFYDGMAEGDSSYNGADAYRRSAGEVEARAVEKRMDYTPEQRKARPPWLDYDVPEENQIVRFADGKSGKKEGQGPMFAMADLGDEPAGISGLRRRGVDAESDQLPWGGKRYTVDGNIYTAADSIQRIARNEISLPMADELREALKLLKDGEIRILTEAFGGDVAKAKRWKELWNIAERDGNGPRAEKADAERAKMSEDATGDLDGVEIGDAPLIGDILRIYEDMEKNPTEIADILVPHLAQLPLAEKNPIGWTLAEAKAVAIMRKAGFEMDANGLDVQQVSRDLQRKYTSYFSDPKDAEFMVAALQASIVNRSSSAVQPAIAKPDGSGPMFAMADTQQPPEINQVSRLSDRLSKLAAANQSAIPDMPERVNAALNVLTTLREAGAERGLDLNGDGVPDNVVEIAQARAIAQITETLGPERAAQVAQDMQTILKDVPTEPEALAARINEVLDQYFPEPEKKMAANDNQDLGPVSPVEVEMHNIERFGALMELIGVCRG